jgi:hypothetical protein
MKAGFEMRFEKKTSFAGTRHRARRREGAVDIPESSDEGIIDGQSFSMGVLVSARAILPATDIVLLFGMAASRTTFAIESGRH